MQTQGMGITDFFKGIYGKIKDVYDWSKKNKPIK